MSRHTRTSIVSALHARIDAGQPALLSAGSVGLVAKAAALEGADIVLAYNIGPFRMDGQGSLIGYLPYGDANAITFGMARAVVPAAGDTPVVAGIGAADPYRTHEQLIREAVGLGYSGITNTPTAGVYSGEFRNGLEASGLGYGREIELFRKCNELDVFAVAYVFDEDQARHIAEAGVDVIIIHLGLTVGTSDAGVLEAACALTERTIDVIRSVRSEPIVGVHGGPLETPDTVQQVLSNTRAQAYVGGSAVERIPVERAVRTATAEFRALTLRS